MTTLILTEKPSVAKDFAKALGVSGRRDGFLEGKEYVITWAVGHLVEPAEPADYDDKWKRWSLGSLPILPSSLKYKPIPEVAKQLSIVQGLLRRKDVSRLVIATDAGREGEVIARTIIQTVEGHRGETFRFWTSQALTPQVVLDTLRNLKAASEYDRLWNAGQARQFADWLVGMNLSRAATLKLRGADREIFSVGRVQTAVLALLVDRRKERESFTPEPYWLLRAQFLCPQKGNWWGTWFRGDRNRFEQQEEAQRTLAAVEGQTGKVRSAKREKKRLPPPLLYSLTDLQREANAKFGLSAKQTLDIAQGLYEARKCLSYPRTDSQVLGSQNLDMVKKLVDKLAKPYGEIFQGVEHKRISLSNKRVFNDAKLTDHHALIPLAPLPTDAGSNEKHIYDLVLKRFAAAFYPDYEYEATEVITEVCKETFRTKGNRPLVPGWKAVYGSGAGRGDGLESSREDEPEEENLPLIQRNDPATVVQSNIVKEMTRPPPEYTEGLLLKDMTNPSRYVSQEELQKIFKGDIGLGTQATRAQIIETLLNRQYVVREKKKLTATDKGCFLIEQLRKFRRARAIAAPEETARWEMELEKIAQGIGNRDEFMAGIRKFVEDGVEEFKMSGGGGEQMTAGQPLGTCPACGGEIIEGKRGFGCRNWKEQDGGCRFVVWKEIAGRRLDLETLHILLSGELTPPLEFTSKEGKPFSASLRLERNEQAGKWDTRFVFPDRGDGSGGETLGTCPRCGAEVVEGKKGFGCKNWRQEDGGCRFVIWKVIAGKELPREAVVDLLTKGETGPIQGFISRKGTEFSARLRIEGEEYKTTFVF